MKKPEKIQLGNVCSGAAAEVFERELARVLENIADVNTDAEATRGITLKFKFAPNAKRSVVAIAYQVTASIAPIKTEASSAFIAMEAGELGLYSMNLDQGILPLDEGTKAPVVEEIRTVRPAENVMKAAPPQSN